MENLINHKNAQKIKCHLKKLDNETQKLMIESVDFIKCDAEGAELFVLQGAEKTLRVFKPIILIELYEEWCNKCGYTSNDILKFLKSINYEIFQTINGKLCKVEEVTLVDDVRYNYFFLDKEKHKHLIEKHSH